MKNITNQQILLVFLLIYTILSLSLPLYLKVLSTEVDAIIYLTNIFTIFGVWLYQLMNYEEKRSWNKDDWRFRTPLKNLLY